MRGKVSPWAGTDEAIAERGVALDWIVELRALSDLVDDKGVVILEEARVENIVVVRIEEIVTVSSNPVSPLLEG